MALRADRFRAPLPRKSWPGRVVAVQIRFGLSVALLLFPFFVRVGRRSWDAAWPGQWNACVALGQNMAGAGV